MLEERLELSWGRPRWILNPARLPISPLQQKVAGAAECEKAVGAIVEVIQVLVRARQRPVRQKDMEPRRIELLTSTMPL